MIQRGWKLIQAHRPEEAVRLFKRAAARYPDDAIVHRAYQISMANLGRSRAVEAEYRVYAGAQPESGLAAYLYSSAILDDDKAAHAVIADALKPKYDQRETMLKMPPPDPWLFETHRVIDSIKDINQGREELAARLLKDITLPGPAYDARQLRAYALAELGRYDEAVRELQGAVAEIPFDPANYISLAGIYYAKAEFAKALEAADRALELRESANARSWRAAALGVLGRSSEAQAEAARIMAAAPQSVDDYIAIGSAYLSRYPELPDTLRAGAYLREGKRRSSFLAAEAFGLVVDGSRGRCKELLAINPHSMTLLMACGAVYYGLGDPPGAIGLFDAVLKINPRSIDAMRAKLQACSKCPGFGELRTAEAALKLAPNDWWVVTAAAETYKRYGRAGEAARLSKRAGELDPAPDQKPLSEADEKAKAARTARFESYAKGEAAPRGVIARLALPVAQWLGNAEVRSAVEYVARHSPKPASRAAAMNALAATRDPRFGPACVSNLSFVAWSARAKRERRVPAPPGFEDAIAKMNAVCEPGMDSIRWETMACLSRVEYPGAIPALLGLARSSASLRREALRTLSKIAKQDFGRSRSHAEPEACRAFIEDAWELASSSRALGQADVERVTALASMLEHDAAQALAGKEDERAIEAWEAWWRGQAGRVPPRYVDKAVAYADSPPLLDSRVTLCSSGKVTSRSRQPGFTNESSAWGSLDDFDSYVTGYPGFPWARERRTSAFASPRGAKILEWIHKTAIPDLREARGRKEQSAFSEDVESSCKDRSEYLDTVGPVETVGAAIAPLVRSIP